MGYVRVNVFLHQAESKVPKETNENWFFAKSVMCRRDWLIPWVTYLLKTARYKNKTKIWEKNQKNFDLQETYRLLQQGLAP